MIGAFRCGCGRKAQSLGRLLIRRPASQKRNNGGPAARCPPVDLRVVVADGSPGAHGIEEAPAVVPSRMRCRGSLDRLQGPLRSSRPRRLSIEQEGPRIAPGARDWNRNKIDRT